MDTEFELSNTDRFGALLLRKEHLAKSNEYYQKLHPTEAKEVDDRLAAEKAKAEAKAKADAEAKAKAAAAAAAKPVSPLTAPTTPIGAMPKSAPTPAPPKPISAAEPTPTQ